MKSFVLNLDEQQLSVIAEGLSNLPYRIAQPVIEHVHREIQRQQQEASDAQ